MSALSSAPVLLKNNGSATLTVDASATSRPTAAPINTSTRRLAPASATVSRLVLQDRPSTTQLAHASVHARTSAVPSTLTLILPHATVFPIQTPFDLDSVIVTTFLKISFFTLKVSS